LELLAHATELFADDSRNKQKYKFVILHLSNAVELILKDCLIDQGVSIYKKNNSKETINIWSAFANLDDLGISIPERPVIELLIDDRNTIQHRFGFPTALTVVYYLEHVIPFFTRFLKEQYNINLAEALEPYLSRENIALLGLIEGDFRHLKKLSQVSPAGAVLHASKIIEREVQEVLGGRVPLWNAPPSFVFCGYLKGLTEKGCWSDDITDKFGTLQNARNQIPFTLSSETKDVDWQSALDIAIQFLAGLSKAKEDNASG
jgi:hypothetical protein